MCSPVSCPLLQILARLVDHPVSAGVHGLTALGSKGEFAYLSWAQCRRVVEVVLRANAGLKLQGFPVGNPLSPEEPLGPEAREEIRLALKKVKALYAEKNQETSGSTASPDTPTELLFRERANGRRFERRLYSGNGCLNQGKGTHLLLAR